MLPIAVTCNDASGTQGRAGRELCPSKPTRLCESTVGVQTSPARVVFATLATRFGSGNVLPVPLPSRIPAHASLTVFLLTVLLFPVEPQLLSSEFPLGRC